jgi:hypothetical protein
MTESMQWSGALAGLWSMGADPLMGRSGAEAPSPLDAIDRLSSGEEMGEPLAQIHSSEQFHEQVLPGWSGALAGTPLRGEGRLRLGAACRA